MATDLRQSDGWDRYLSSQGWEVEELKIQNSKVKVYIKRLPILGSVIKIQRPPVIPPISAVDKIARKHRALFAKLEPSANGGSTINYKLLTSHGFIRDSSPNLPTKTIITDLTKSEKELWRDLSQDARQSVRRAESNQLSVISYQGSEIREQLQRFHQLLKETGRRQGFWIPSLSQLKTKFEYFGKNAILFLAFPSVSDQPVAGALNLIHDGTSYGHLASSSEEGKKLYASYFLMWEMIKFFKNPKPHPPATPERSDPPASSREASRAGGGRGTLPPKADPPLAENPIRYFDLEGIYDPRYHKFTKSWQGFTLFKRKFGGKEVAYPQPLIKYYHPLAKLLFKLSAL